VGLTIVKQRQIDDGPADVGGKRLKFQIGTITFDSSYPDGGEELDLSGDFDTLHMVILEQGPLFLTYDYANKKVIAYWFDYDGVADGVAVAVLATTDLSAYTMRYMAWGE